VNSVPGETQTVRQHAQALLGAIGISRIIVVDDEYSEGRHEVEELLGICTALDAADAAKLAHFGEIDFEADREIWAEAVRKRWVELSGEARKEAITSAYAINTVQTFSGPSAAHEEQPQGQEGSLEHTPEASGQPPAGDAEMGLRAEQVTSVAGGGAGVVPVPVDSRAAESLEEVIAGLDECVFVALSLRQWREQADQLLADEMAATTVFLFDRNFEREQQGSENEGFNLVREVQNKRIGYCGLISHTVQLGGEYDAWRQLAEEHSLSRDKFVVIAKERLTGESPDHYSFLRMLRLVALSGRCANVKAAAWKVFEESVSAAKAAMERLSVLDFDQIVFASSRREGVWEPDTLFRVFGIFMRREARTRLYQDQTVPAAVTEARRVSAIPEEVAAALGNESPSREALRIQRFETYELDETLNRFCLPLDLGDVFERASNGRRYILLAQPCDLMVRKDGKRSYEDKKFGRTGALVELLVDRTQEEAKESWAELPFYDPDTGAQAYADFAKVHQVRLAVLDLCVLSTDGAAAIEADDGCPDFVIEPWKLRCKRLRKFFAAALARYEELAGKGVKDELKVLALPALSETLRVPATVDGTTLRYGLKRVMRFRQPWSGALLTAFARYHARAAFEHPFDHRVPMSVESNDDECAGVDDGLDGEA